MRISFFSVLIFAACAGTRTYTPPHLDLPANEEPTALSAVAEEPARPSDTGISANLIDCIFKSQADLSAGIPPGTTIGVIKIYSNNEGEAEFAEEQLIFFLVQSGKYRVVERRDLDIIRREQNFQLSGDVDDETAVSIGRMAGAQIVITGSILPFGPVRFLNLRALDVETAQIRAASSRAFSSFF